MTPNEGFNPELADPAIVTRSDHAPTDYERYGDWARKFFGHGWHQKYKDSETTLLDARRLVARPATCH